MSQICQMNCLFGGFPPLSSPKNALTPSWIANSPAFSKPNLVSMEHSKVECQQRFATNVTNLSCFGTPVFLCTKPACKCHRFAQGHPSELRPIGTRPPSWEERNPVLRGAVWVLVFGGDRAILLCWGDNFILNPHQKCSQEALLQKKTGPNPQFPSQPWDMCSHSFQLINGMPIVD